MTQTTWQHRSGTITAHDGTALYYESWTPPTPKALILYAHGMWEHLGRHNHVIERLVNTGCAVYALDHRGHGRSGGQRGHVERFDRYLQDFHKLFKQGTNDLGLELPRFALGHSFGGLLVLRYALNYPEMLEGVIASAPALLLAWQPPAWKRVVGKTLSRVIPTISLPNGLDPSLLSRDPNVIISYNQDPLVHDLTTARAYTEISATMAATLAEAHTMMVPFLIVHGDADNLNSLEGSRLFFARATLTDKSLFVLPSVRHELFNEPEPDRSRVLDEVVSWVRSHIPS